MEERGESLIFFFDTTIDWLALVTLLCLYGVVPGAVDRSEFWGWIIERGQRGGRGEKEDGTERGAEREMLLPLCAIGVEGLL